MSFLQRVAQARALLESHGRISLRALKRELDLDDPALEELVAELVQVQRVATRDASVLAWSAPREAVAAAPASHAEGERRQLTVMFCDLVSSTELARRLDAEDWRNVVRAYQASAAECIARYEGHIAQFLGDGILVYFGYPRAHEEDAERAVRAGREILTGLDVLNERLEREHDLRLAVRIGVHTGSVVVGEMGSGGRSETLALGDTTIVAARLAGVAEPDSIVISDVTLRLVAGMFVIRDLGTPTLKGIAEPIHAYAALQTTGVRSRLDIDPSHLTPLVGRRRELGVLCARWAEAQAGDGRAVLISGEPGSGKSRLLQAFRQRLAGEAHGWLECRCSPYGQGSAFQPVVELAVQALGFRESDDAEARLARLEAALEISGLSAPDVVPLLAPLFSLPLPGRYPALGMSPELQRERTLAAMVAWIRNLAAQQPLVMLVEDLHWCDPSTLDLLTLLLEGNAGDRLLTLLTFRPEFEPTWPQHPHVTRLEVKRLTRSQARNMVARMTGGAPLPDVVAERIVERADGIPLFVEELTKTMLESGLVVERKRLELTGPLSEDAVPSSLQDSLMARLDRLGEGKAVAQLAAVLGREFAYDLLRLVSPLEEAALRRGLERLVEAGLIYRRGAACTFKHALIQETAYRSLLRSVRRQYHARIAAVVEERFPDRVESEPETLARHHEEAGHLEEAVAYYTRAGARATERSANEEAIGHLQSALRLVAGLPVSPERDARELALQMAIAAPLFAARGWAHPECEAVYQRARDLASAIEDAPDLPRILVGLSLTSYVRGDLVAATELGHQALALVGEGGEPFDVLSAHLAVGQPLFFRGHPERCLHHMQEAIRRYDPRAHAHLAHTLGIDRGVVARCFAGMSHWALGRPDRGLALAREAAALARRVEHPISLAVALFWVGTLHHMRREREPSRQCAQELIALSEQRGFPLYLGLARVQRGWALADAGEAEAGIAEIREGLAGVIGTSAGVGAIAVVALLAEAYLKAGRHQEGLDVLAAGLERAEATGQHYYDAEVLRLRAEILLDRPDAPDEEPEAILRRSLAVAHDQGAIALALRSAITLADLLARGGRADEGRELLSPVFGAFEEGLDAPDLARARALLAGLA